MSNINPEFEAWANRIGPRFRQRALNIIDGMNDKEFANVKLAFELGMQQEYTVIAELEGEIEGLKSALAAKNETIVHVAPTSHLWRTLFWALLSGIVTLFLRVYNVI